MGWGVALTRAVKPGWGGDAGQHERQGLRQEHVVYRRPLAEPAPAKHEPQLDVSRAPFNVYFTYDPAFFSRIAGASLPTTC
jgi:hypothetical protein